jgi:UDP-N-acetylmuramoyl-tripeptide--D-alanyl-D-alanine ligase
LLTFGPLSKYTSEAFGAKAQHYESKEVLANELKKTLTDGDVILIKGSRGIKMEEVVNRLMNDNDSLKTKDQH